MVPVPKTTHPKEPNHFRPFALTSHLMKTMERIILHHLRPLVGRDLDPLQFAYQPNIIYLLHWAFSHLESTRCTVRVMFFYFSRAFNTIQPSVLRGKLQWVRPQYVRLQDCVSEVVVCSTGPPQGTVLAPFLFTLHAADFSYNTDTCHLQKFSNDIAIVGQVSKGNKLEYRRGHQ